MNKKNDGKQLQYEFGTLIRQKRKEKQITQEKLAEIAGITDVYLRDLERGNYTATWIIFLKLCAALNIDIKAFQCEYILPEVEQIKKGIIPRTREGVKI